MISYWLFRLISSLVKALPLQVSYRGAERVADLVFLLWSRGRRNTLQNLRQVLGPDVDSKRIAHMGRTSFRNYARYIVDFLRLAYLTKEEIKALVSFQNWDSLDRALEMGRGAILVGIHMGNWDMGAALAAQHDYRINAVVDTFPNPKLDALVQGIRRRTGVKTIAVKDAQREVLRVLRRNEVLAFLIDRPSPDNGVPATFFGKLTYVPAGAARLALRTGATVIPAVVTRLPDDTFLGVMEPPVAFEPSGELKRDVQALTQEIMKSLEGIVRRYPDQWFMFRPMWAS